MISSFRNQYSFLSNFYVHPLVWDGETWASGEHAYQASKTFGIHRAVFKGPITCGQARRIGRNVPLREGWTPELRVKLMLEVQLAKYPYGSELAILLMRTSPHELVEGNYWHDNFWGKCTCMGCSTEIHWNTLGKLLMLVREQLLNKRIIDGNKDSHSSTNPEE